MNTTIARKSIPGLALGLMVSLSQGFAAISSHAAAAPPKLNVQEGAVPRDSHPASFAPVVQKVSPNVVNVFVTKASRSLPRLPMFDDPLFRDFFGPGGPGGAGGSMPRERREQGLGSGVVVTEDGYILTNSHVVEGADEVKVVFPEGQREFTGKVVGADPQTDIAVIKVEGKDLPSIAVTDSDNLQVGDVVLAVGNPFGVGQTVTMGIVSAKGRGGMGIVDYEDFIQTDASINPGNSGGALVDAEGRLVGINTAILSGTGGNQGIGFAVPVNLIRSVMDQLVSEGKVSRGFLGVVIQPVTPDLATAFKLPGSGGALISEVTPKSPAEEAGLKEGDVVIEFNGKKVTDSRNLRLMAAQTPPGTKATMRVIRDGKEKRFTVELAELPTEGLARADRPGVPGGRKPRGEEDALSVEVTDLQPSLRRQFNVPSQMQGAVVVNVDPNSPAASAGLQPGDVILEINREPVTTADEAIERSQNLKSQRTLLRVWSRGASRYVVLEAEKKR
jgi:serine protease Do